MWGFSMNRPDLWSSKSGPICIKVNTPVLTLFQLATRSLRSGHRRLHIGLVENEGVRPPSLEPNSQSSGEDTNPGSQHRLDCTSVEVTTVVSTPTSNASRPSTPSSSSGGRGSSSGTSAGHVEHIRKRFRDQQLSTQATELILKSWKTKTNKSYDSLFGRWH